ncbi:hypothetical protein L596_028343 [Steinernema carpocapsae]|uniref:Uncharacterized protein n=1 Tax=Steinernema carpocapsae TaxID=34508 RepID=A0A4U5LY80_STECR|nr:hypothetical protein L596_028343 [Steinernema carpocapsae]
MLATRFTRLAQRSAFSLRYCSSQKDAAPQDPPNRTSFKCEAEKPTAKPWEDPWKHALPEEKKTYTEFKEIPVNWNYVERLLPLETIPEMPKMEASYESCPRSSLLHPKTPRPSSSAVLGEKTRPAGPEDHGIRVRRAGQDEQRLRRRLCMRKGPSRIPGSRAGSPGGDPRGRAEGQNFGEGRRAIPYRAIHFRERFLKSIGLLSCYTLLLPLVNEIKRRLIHLQRHRAIQ